MNQRFCNGMVHVIKEGETLYQLSRMYRIPVALLMRANPYVDVYNLQPGQEICIPMSRPFPGMMPNFNRPQPGPEPPCQGEEKREDRVEVVSESEPVQDVEKTEQAENCLLYTSSSGEKRRDWIADSAKFCDYEIGKFSGGKYVYKKSNSLFGCE